MKNFNITRFWQTLRWTVFTEKRTLIAIAIASLAGSLLIQMFFTFSLISPMQVPERYDIEIAMRLCAVAYVILLLFYASRVCSNVRSPRQRATALMLPASKAEKFTARIVFCLVLLPLLSLAAVSVATCIRLLLELLANHHSIYGGWGTLFSVIFEEDSLLDAFTNLWFISLFLLAGVFFRRVPFLWMWGVIATAIVIISMIMAFVMIASKQQTFTASKGFEITFTILLPIFTVFNVWLSYRLYKRLQIVQNKLFNV